MNGLFSRFATAALALGVIAGCTANGVDTPYRAVHPITVSEGPQLLELPVVSSDAAPLSDADRLRTEAFAREYLGTGESSLTIAYPKESETSALRVVRAVAKSLRSGGVPRNRLLRGAYSSETEGERGIVLSFVAKSATSAECPSFIGDATRDRGNNKPRYFGCSTQNNLAAMVDRPNDLLEPRAVTAASSERRQQVLTRYRAGASTASEDADRQIETSE